MISVRAPIGAINFSKEKCCIGRGLAALSPDEKKLSSEFLFWYLKRKNKELNKKGTGSTFKAINKKILEEIQIPDIDLKQQQLCAKNLNRIYSIIQKRKYELKKFDDLVQARFVEMFGMPGTDPHGWGLVTLGSVCHINPKKGEDSIQLDSDANVSFVPMTAVTEHGEIDVSVVKNYDEIKTGFTYFAENDVLFAKITPCMENGKGAIAKGLCNGIGFGSTEFHVIRPINGKTNSYWIYVLTVFSQFRKDAAINMTGSAGQRRVPLSFLDDYRVSVPPIKLQEQFATFVRQIDKSKADKKIINAMPVI